MRLVPSLLLFAFLALPLHAQEGFETDVIKTSAGALEITFLGHASLMMKFGGRTIYVDPFSEVADFSKLPKADLLLITHEHEDHFDLKAIEAVRAKHTKIILTEKCAETLSNEMVMKNGDRQVILYIKIEAVPAYNLVHVRENGRPYHPVGQGNGYILAFGTTRIYIAGDTENIPELKILENIDIAFLPMNLPYTMTPAMVADAADEFKPKVLYPYHTGDTDISKLTKLMHHADVEVRIRKMQ